MRTLVSCIPWSIILSANDEERTPFIVFLASASTQITTDLYPILSMTHIDPCFADIRVPSAVSQSSNGVVDPKSNLLSSQFYYDESQWSPKYSHPDNIAWADKREVLCTTKLPP